MSHSSRHINIAQTDDERSAIFKFRYQVYIEEMGKPYSHADHKRKQLSDPLDENATLLYSTVAGKIVGTLRINWGNDIEAINAFTQPCGLFNFRSFPASSWSFCSRLMVHKAYRYSSLALALSLKAYQTGRERDIQFNFVHCVPKLVGLFERMGFRQYKQRFKDAEIGVQVPLVLVVEDINHLSATRSPFLAAALKRPNNCLTGLWFVNQFSIPQEEGSGIKETINNYVFDKLSISVTAT